MFGIAIASAIRQLKALQKHGATHVYGHADGSIQADRVSSASNVRHIGCATCDDMGYLYRKGKVGADALLTKAGALAVSVAEHQDV
jgi:hypothetical protein